MKTESLRFRALLAVGIGLTLFALSGCARFVPVVRDRGEERFEFVMVPGNLNPAQAADEVGSDNGDVLQASNPVSVDSSDGIVTVITYTVAGPSFCLSVSSQSGGSVTCGSESRPEDQNLEALSMVGFDRWSQVLVSVGDQATEVTAITDDGTGYECRPEAGYCFFEWWAERGNLTVITYDEAGNEIDSLPVAVS